jgi:hypothetical protein
MSNEIPYRTYEEIQTDTVIESAVGRFYLHLRRGSEDKPVQLLVVQRRGGCFEEGIHGTTDGAEEALNRVDYSPDGSGSPWALLRG